MSDTVYGAHTGKFFLAREHNYQYKTPGTRMFCIDELWDYPICQSHDLVDR